MLQVQMQWITYTLTKNKSEEKEIGTKDNA